MTVTNEFSGRGGGPPRADQHEILLKIAQAKVNESRGPGYRNGMFSVSVDEAASGRRSELEGNPWNLQVSVFRVICVTIKMMVMQITLTNSWFAERKLEV